MKSQDQPFRTFEDLEEVVRLKQIGWRAFQVINGYIRYLRSRKAGDSTGLQETSSDYVLKEADMDTILSYPHSA
jgi:hypothetical protein